MPDKIAELQAEIERLKAELESERKWREELQKLSIDLTVENEKLKGLQ